MIYDGDLKYLEPYVQGYKPEGRGTFKITFTERTDNVVKLQNQIRSGSNTFKNAKGTEICVQILNPRSPTKTVTLRPVPLEYPLDELKNFIANEHDWGTPVKVS